MATQNRIKISEQNDQDEQSFHSNLKQQTCYQKMNFTLHSIVIHFVFIAFFIVIIVMLTKIIQDLKINKQSIKNQQLLSKIERKIKNKYTCEDIVFLSSNQQSKEIQVELSISKIQKILLKNWTQEQLNENLLKSAQKCAFIDDNDMKPSFVNFVGLQYMFFFAKTSSNLIYNIKEQISKNSLQKRVLLIQKQKINNQILYILKFIKDFQSSQNGYFIGNSNEQFSAQHKYFPFFSTKLIQFYKSQKATSILDLGCGLCSYVLDLKNNGFYVEGYDGNPFTPDLTKGIGKVADLTSQQDFIRKFDWVQSFEVGQHIPPQKTQIFLKNINKHAIKGVVISWAIIGQNGYAHINQKSNDDVIKMLRKYNLIYDEKKTIEFRKVKDISWFKNTLMVFRRK